MYYAITNWNYYLQGADVIACNDHKPLAKFLNGKNINNKVDRMGLELLTYYITSEWISGAWNKADDCLSRLVELPTNSTATIKMLTATHLARPAFKTRSKTTHQYQANTDTEPSSSQPTKEAFIPDLTTVETTQDITPKPLTADRHKALLHMKIDTFCKHISRWLLNGKAPQHEADLFTHVKGLLYKHIMDANQKFMALIIPKAWKYTVFVETHDKLGHQGVTRTCCLIK